MTIENLEDSTFVAHVELMRVSMEANREKEIRTDISRVVETYKIFVRAIQVMRGEGECNK